MGVRRALSAAMPRVRVRVRVRVGVGVVSVSVRVSALSAAMPARMFG